MASEAAEQATAAERDARLGRMWMLLTGALAVHVRARAATGSPLDAEDVRDIAAEKALELLRRFDRGEWSPTRSTPAQLCRFVDTLARNGLVDHRRSARVRRTRPLPELGDETAPVWTASPDSGAWAAESGADAPRFATGLRGCVAKLSRRSRTIWFLRVFCELPSKTIAHHPEVNSSAAAIDMTLSRCRAQLAECMRAQGLEPREMPAGAFVLVWEALRSAPTADDTLPALDLET